MALAIDPLIRLDGISKIFHTEEVETHALSRVSLEIRAGEFVAVCGPSGCGKTTLLSLLGLLDSPSEGSYVLAGEPVASLTPVQRARVRCRAIGFIFQAFNLIGDLDVYSNVELPLKYRGLPPTERRAMVHEALDRVGLLHRIHHFPASMLMKASRMRGVGRDSDTPLGKFAKSISILPVASEFPTLPKLKSKPMRVRRTSIANWSSLASAATPSSATTRNGMITLSIRAVL